MNTICEIITGLTGAFLLFSAFIMNTKDIQSAIYFKLIPFVLGSIEYYKFEFKLRKKEG